MSRAAELRGIALLLDAPETPVVAVGRGLFSVASSRGGKHYTVDLAREPWSCTCPHWIHRN